MIAGLRLKSTSQGTLHKRRP